MKIIDILKLCDYRKIEEKIKFYYGNDNLCEYEKLYNELMCRKTDSADDCGMYITIKAYLKETDMEVEDFSENDTSLWFDVSGFINDDDEIYSIASSGYSEFLLYDISEETLEKFSYETILAHCFYEVTFYGFEDFEDFSPNPLTNSEK